MVKIIKSCECENPTFVTTRGVQVDVEIDQNGEHIKDISFGDYYDDLGENIIRCKMCGKEARCEDEDE